MNNVLVVLQLVVALGLLNVWLLRFNKSTAYRGGSAKNLKEEFAAYGLPTWFMYLIGALKIGSAVALLAGFWIPSLVMPAASLVVLLMLGALVMHIKVRDPLMKSMPAALMLVMGLLISLNSVN
ncbi:DoxX family protein [bacterium]|nr:DoxX family protein [bacterium]